MKSLYCVVFGGNMALLGNLLFKMLGLEDGDVYFLWAWAYVTLLVGMKCDRNGTKQEQNGN